MRLPLIPSALWPRNVKLGRLVRRLMLASPLLLTACLEKVPLIPSGATQTITVSAEGKLSMSYAGRFYHPYDETLEMVQLIGDMGASAGRDIQPESVPDRATAQRDLTSRLQREFPGLQLKDRGQGFFDMSLPPAAIAETFFPGGAVFLATVDQQASIVEIAADPSIDREIKTLQGSGSESFLGIIDRTLQKHYHGTLVVRTQGRVVRHNADSTKRGAEGYTEYVWALSAGHRKPSMVIDLNRYSAEQLKLLSARPGTSCVELIGQACKCGPFQLIQPDGTPIANTRVLIRTDTLEVQRCSDANGHVEALKMDVTSRLCAVILENRAGPCH